MLDSLELFRKKMRNPEWKHHFDHTFRPIFYAAGNRLIGPPSSGFGGSAYRKIAGRRRSRRCCCRNAALFRRNLSETESGDRYWIYGVNEHWARRRRRLSPDQIKKREMDVHQACIGILVRHMNKYRDSSVGSEMNVQCPDSKVYSMPLLLMPARCCFGRVDRNPLLPRLPILLAPSSPLSVSRQPPPLRRCAAASAAAAPFHNPPRPPWWPQGLSLPRASLRRGAGQARGPLPPLC